ncbi:Short-chain dehydrogenase [Natronincola peptidivorans]|uniref:Short-chain dehydrogenase n=1 Tax=Natronincola peptidivorans TaxID=426128 RepID=A0A1H9Y3T3_9FIRM|nr:SDR family NAD(P)-dependent oxidoreductase [Natronincola peptidivorans]SES63404.1 Short-chain dehydrogenase [Natronincola peptidivorans]
MKEFKNRTAVITGAANGFGFEVAKECARREMKVVMADIDGEDLKKASQTVKEMGVEVLTVEMDTSVYEEMENLAKQTLETFRTVDLLFNNAGVVTSGSIWEMPLKDWEWTMGVNVWGMMYAMRVFVPIMLKQQTPCHVVNVASVAGLLTTPGMPAYHTTKFATVAMTESANYQLQMMNANVKMSVYCPGFVQTDLHNCEKRRPERFKIDPDHPYYQSESYRAGLAKAEHVITTGIPITSVAQSIFTAIEEEQFYILTHPQYNPVIGLRVKTMLEGKNPSAELFRK